MSSIPVVHADGREPLPICRRYREWLTGYYKDASAIVLRFFSDAAPVRERDKAEDWVSTIVSQDHYRRQSRLARYCCVGMFCAVEVYVSHQTPRFSFTMFRGEDPCWQIDGQDAFAVYCPWCGTKLPPAPFVEDAP